MSPENAVWSRLVRMFTHVESHLANGLLREHGLGLSEYRALEHLSTAKDSELRMQELAEFLCLNQSSVTRLAGRLEEVGLAIRDQCPDDKRGVYAVLTDAGRKRYEEARGSYERFLSEALEDAADVSNTKDIAKSLQRLARKPQRREPTSLQVNPAKKYSTTANR